MITRLHSELLKLLSSHLQLLHPAYIVNS